MKNNKFSKQESSPFTKEELQHFEQLQYFPVNPSLRLEAKLDKSAFPTYFSLFQDSSVTQIHQEVGVLKFEIEGSTYALKAFRSAGQAKHQLFVPFKDLSNGKLTYGGGRYVDAVLGEDSLVKLDFNLAYNPYCAYNERFVCAAVPATNSLPIEVLAGEKNYN